jgi:hypothetical protein
MEISDTRRTSAQNALQETALAEAHRFQRVHVALEILKNCPPADAGRTVDQKVYDAANAVILDLLVGPKAL